MFRHKLLVAGLLAIAVSSAPTAVALGGGMFGSADPARFVPASADVYVALDRGAGQGMALATLVKRYTAHPGTGALVAQLRASLGMGGLRQLKTLSGVAGNRVGVAVWSPPSAPATAQPHVAVIAQLSRASLASLSGGGNPLQGLVTFSNPMPYHGETVYRILFNGGGSGYGAVIEGDGILASDLIAVERVVDTATFRAPSLAANADYTVATGQLPLARALTVYVSARYLQRAQRAARGAVSTPGAPGTTGQATPAAAPAVRRVGLLKPARHATGATARVLTWTRQAARTLTLALTARKALAPLVGHPIALAVTAQAGGIGLVTSDIATGTRTLAQPTPNRAASVVGGNAILYTSLENLAGTLTSSGLLTPKALAQVKAQTGIDVGRDLLPLLSHEVAIDVNGETSPLLQQLIKAGSNGAATVPTIPGSLELVMEVTDPLAARRALSRLAGGLAAALQPGSLGGASDITRVVLPDGTTGYAFSALPGVEFTFRGNLLLLSTSLPADIRAARTPLSTDPSYQGALAHVAGPGALLSVSYLSTTRLLAVLDRIVPATATGRGTSSGVASLRKAEALVAPFSTFTAAMRQVGALGDQLRAFVTIQ